MNLDARIYCCNLCRCQVQICRNCDRGNIYCNGECAKLARQSYQRASSERYQNTYQGKRNHAARQMRYRQRQKEKKEIVTHHGSIKPLNRSPSSLPDKSIAQDEGKIKTPKKHCCFCRRVLSGYSRLGFLRHSDRLYNKSTTVNPRGP